MVVLLRRHRRRGARSSALGRTTIHTSPLDGFDKVKMAYKRRRKDAESSRDAEYFVKLDRAYDTVMMEQVQNRKKGVAYGSIQVAKDIKYADHQPIVPWGPRYSRSTAKDLRINMAISASFIMCLSTMGHADWKPLQFLCFAYFYRILEKLKATEPAVTPVYNVRSMVRLKVGVYTWQNECSVVWVWYLDQYLLHPWATLDWPISLSFLGSIFYLLFIISRS